MKTASNLFAIALLVPTIAIAQSTSASPTQTLRVSSPRFANHGAIPSEYTCEGKNVSPPLVWSAGPASAKSYALIVEDPDSPDPKLPSRTWVHWVVFDIPSSVHSLAQGELPVAASDTRLPNGAQQGMNDKHLASYDGPCPPIGTHRYFFKVYALDTILPASVGAPTKDELERAMTGHIVATGETVGLYALKPSSPPRSSSSHSTGCSPRQ